VKDDIMSKRKNKNNKQPIEKETTTMSDTDQKALENTNVDEGIPETPTEEVVVEDTATEPVIEPVIDPVIEPVVEGVSIEKEEPIIPIVETASKLSEELDKVNIFANSIKDKLKYHKEFIAERSAISDSEILAMAKLQTEIVIAIHDNGDKEALEAYLEYLVHNPNNNFNVINIMDNVMKTGSRLRNSIVTMQSAFEIIASATRRKVKPNINTIPIKKDIVKIKVVNFILSCL
jgi:hypothetical protein